MTLGQRILQARQEAGLSQRALAGQEITRNMLSALEHDNANPSLSTLQLLAKRLGKSVSWLLGEEDPLAPAWEAFDRGEFRRCRELLAGSTDRQGLLLLSLATVREAEQAVREGRLPYGAALLEGFAPAPELSVERQLALLRARCDVRQADAIGEDDALLLKAEAALLDGRTDDAERYLQALDHRDGGWHRLMGELCFRRGDYPAAADHFHRCEDRFDVRERLEICYREQGDYKMAYYYAKK